MRSFRVYWGSAGRSAPADRGGPLGAHVTIRLLGPGRADEPCGVCNPVVVGGGTPFLPPVTEDVPLDLIETRTFGSRVIYERYRRVRDDSD